VKDFLNKYILNKTNLVKPLHLTYAFNSSEPFRFT